jgi:hypothetical protein
LWEHLWLFERHMAQAGTDFTDRQKEGFDAIGNGATEMNVHRNYPPKSVTPYFTKDTKIPVDKAKCVRISDHGTSTEAINLNIEAIDYGKIKLPK